MTHSTPEPAPSDAEPVDGPVPAEATPDDPADGPVPPAASPAEGEEPAGQTSS